MTGTGFPARVTWAGSDPDGSGVNHYLLDMSRDGGKTWTRVLSTLGLPVYTASLPRSGTVRFRAKAIDRAGNVGSWTAGPVMALRYTQDTSASIRWTGRWSTVRAATYSGGTAHWAKASGAAATYATTGRAIAVLGTRGPTRGQFRVYVNGVRVATIDCRAATATGRVVLWQATWSSVKTRTIRIVVLGTPGRPRVDVDSILVVR